MNPLVAIALDHRVCREAALALLHASWLGALLAGFVALICRALPAGACVARYWLNFGGMLGLLLLVPVCAAFIPAQPLEQAMPAVIPISGQPLNPPSDSASSAISPSDVSIATTPATEPKQPGSIAEMFLSVSWIKTNWGSVVVLIYLAGALIMLSRLILAFWGGNRLRSAGEPFVAPLAAARLAEQARRLGLRAAPLLRSCERVAIPVVIGAIRPVILIPGSMIVGLTPDQLAAVLTHELAHIRRYDHIAIVLQRLIEALLFFHPAVWLLSRRVDAEREDCCDDLVLALGAEPMEYAGSLLRVAELRLNADRPLKAAKSGLAADGHQRPSKLRRRIARVLGVAPLPEPRVSPLSFFAVFLLPVLGIGLSLFVAVGQARSALPPVEENPKSPAKRTIVGALPSMDREETEAEWFRSDPYPELGYDENAEDGWHYLRIVTNERAQRELGISAEQSHRLAAVYKAANDRSRALAGMLENARLSVRNANDPVFKHMEKSLTEHWRNSQIQARLILTHEQHRRAEELLVQKWGYRAFLRVDIAQKLGLSPSQRESIQNIIKAHGLRIQDLDRKLADDQAAFPPGEGFDRAVRLALTSERTQKGQASHRQAWQEIRNVFTPEQRDLFEQLRGQPVGSLPVQQTPLQARSTASNSAKSHAYAWGTIRGRVVFEGDAIPPRKAIDIPEAHPLRESGKAKTIAIYDQSLVIHPQNRGVRWVAVWVAKPSAIHPDLVLPPTTHAELRSEGYAFAPRLLAVQAGSSLILKNHDSTAINFHAEGERLRFDFPMPGIASKDMRDRMINAGLDGLQDRMLSAHLLPYLRPEPGPIAIRSHDHPWMQASLRIFNHPYFAVTDENGEFTIPNAPIGPANLIFQHETLGWGPGGAAGQPIVVAPNETTPVECRLAMPPPQR